MGTGRVFPFNITPNVQNYLLWTGDPAAVTATGLTIASATIYLQKIEVPYTKTFTSLDFSVATAHVGNSNTQLGMYSSAGTYLTSSADISTTVQSTGAKSVNLAAAQTITGGPSVFVWVAYHAGVTGGTPGVIRGHSALCMNVGCGASNLRSASIAGHATNPLATIGNLTPSSMAANSVTNIWFGVK